MLLTKIVARLAILSLFAGAVALTAQDPDPKRITVTAKKYEFQSRAHRAEGGGTRRDRVRERRHQARLRLQGAGPREGRLREG